MELQEPLAWYKEHCKELEKSLERIQCALSALEQRYISNGIYKLVCLGYQTDVDYRVLVIEDVTECQQYFQSILEQTMTSLGRSFCIVSTDNVADAELFLKCGHFNLVVSDLQVVDGSMEPILKELSSQIIDHVLMVSNARESDYIENKFYRAWLGKHFSADALKQAVMDIERQ